MGTMIILLSSTIIIIVGPNINPFPVFLSDLMPYWVNYNYNFLPYKNHNLKVLSKS